MDSLIDSIIDMLALTDANRTNESGCKLFIGWSRGAVEVHDILNLAPWTQEIAWCDEYRHVWVSVFHRCTLTYCEGDLTLSAAPDAKSFYNDLATAAEFYEKN